MTPQEQLERAIWDLFYLPSWVSVIDRPELLALRSLRGESHFNCAYRVRGVGDRIDALIAEVDAFHTGVGSRWQVADTIDTADIEARLARFGYVLTTEHDARVVAVSDFVGRSGSGIEVRRVADEATLRDAWRVGARGFGGSTERAEHDAAERVEDELGKCTGDASRIFRYVAYIDEAPVACGNMTIFRDLDFAFMWGGATVPEFRGRGAYSRVGGHPGRSAGAARHRVHRAVRATVYFEPDRSQVRLSHGWPDAVLGTLTRSRRRWRLAQSRPAIDLGVDLTLVISALGRIRIEERAPFDAVQDDRRLGRSKRGAAVRAAHGGLHVVVPSAVHHHAARPSVIVDARSETIEPKTVESFFRI